MKVQIALLLCGLVALAFAGNPACTSLSGLSTCSGVDYDVLTGIANQAQTLDDKIKAAVEAYEKAGYSKECVDAYQNYVCDSAFLECSDTSVEGVCKSDCDAYVSNCNGTATGICDSLPTSDCTKGAGGK